MFRDLSVNPLYLRASYHVYKIGCVLARGIPLPAAQLFVIAIENILRGGVGNLTSDLCTHVPSASARRNWLKICQEFVLFVRMPLKGVGNTLCIFWGRFLHSYEGSNS